MEIKLLRAQRWNDYELLDSGLGYKLERFGKYIISRPEPQALWNPSMPQKKWEQMANAMFIRTAGSEERGQWHLKPGMPEQWQIKYPLAPGKDLCLRLGLTSFKHVGVFPEQAANWDFIYDSCQKIATKTGAEAKVLNLFAYTGGASLAAKAAGADVTHVDSVKQTVNWSRENMELSHLSDIRWVVEDALKFVNRQVKRGAKYNGIILDPPSYGRGANGEKWVLQDNILEMLSGCAQLLEDSDSFLVLNLYSMGLSAMLSHTMVRQIFGENKNTQTGEIYVEDSFGKQLPLGVFLRFYR